MFLQRTLLIAALPLLVLSSKSEQCSEKISHHNSHVLASLQCYNDFTTHIRCTWEEERHHTELYLPFSRGKPCVFEKESQSNGKLIRSCVYKTDLFSVGSHDFSFNTSCPSKVTTFNIATQGKVLPPTNFSERTVNGSNRMLSWNSPYPPSSPLTQNLIYQLKYRRHEHEWIVVDNINITEFEIESQALMPGYSYEAMVRARGPVGLWSDWSPKVEWIMKEEGVINLQCVIKEDGVMCSWQVKKREAEFLLYQLCDHNNGSGMKCVHCHHHAEHPNSGILLDFTCSLHNPEPELLTIEIRSLRKAKNFSNTKYVQPPRPSNFTAQKENGVLKLRWTRPSVDEKLAVSYQVLIENNDPKSKKDFNLSEGDLSFEVPSSLQHSTHYMARVRAAPGKNYAGRPSDWSEPINFTTDQAPWKGTSIYILIAVLVAVLFIILYNALPACHRRFVLWNVSIPSPINSKVLGEMRSKKFLASEANPYTDNEKTSVFVIQTSDNPIICKGSISEYPLLTCSDDTDLGLSMTKSGWQGSSSQLSLFKEGSRMTDKSGVSFIGPYILCREDSSVPTETSDTFFSSQLSFDDDGRYVSESPRNSLQIKGGYILSPPKNPISEFSTSSDKLGSENREPRKSELPDDDPPAYTPSPTVGSSAIFSHPSGYCLMPNMENVAAWVSASVPTPGGNTERQLHEIERVLPERSYVTLSQRGAFQ